MRGTAVLALLALMSGIRTTAAGTCAPRATLAGNAELVVRVASELHRLGVATEPPPAGCGSVAAAVERDPTGGIAVAIRDAAQRTEGRVVGDATVAAVWIDSWLRDDFGDAGETAAPPPALTAPIERGDRLVVVAPVATRSVLDRISIDAAYEQTWSDDGSSWSGVGAGACVLLDVACVGLRVHAAFQPSVTSGMTSAARSDLAALATARRTFSVGRMAISPEVGLGVARLSTSRVDGCKPVMPPPGCDPNDPTTTCPMAPANCIDPSGVAFVGDHFAATNWTPRAAASLHVSIPLLDHVWLEGVASIAATPFHHGDPYTPMPAVNGTAPTDPLALPGEALAAYQLGVGLRIGAP